MSIYNLL